MSPPPVKRHFTFFLSRARFFRIFFGSVLRCGGIRSVHPVAEKREAGDYERVCNQMQLHRMQLPGIPRRSPPRNYESLYLIGGSNVLAISTKALSAESSVPKCFRTRW